MTVSLYRNWKFVCLGLTAKQTIDFLSSSDCAIQTILLSEAPLEVTLCKYDNDI